MLFYNYAGVTVNIPGCGQLTSRAALTCCTCDMPAKAIVLNVVQYNGFYGCSCCLQKGGFMHVSSNLSMYVILLCR